MVLLVFGGVALLVGSFLIFNTFSITVAQRIRELGMLRTLGASRGQILARHGARGGDHRRRWARCSACWRGSAFAGALNAMFKSFGIDLPNTGTVIETRTIDRCARGRACWSRSPRR